MVGIQVGIGIIMKASQTGGSYSFSPSASVTVSESLKMLLSTIFFYNECRKRANEGVSPSTRGLNLNNPYVIDSLPLLAQDTGHDVIKPEESPPNAGTDLPDQVSTSRAPLQFSLPLYWQYIRGEVTKDVRYGFCTLALFYVLINNSASPDFLRLQPSITDTWA